MPVSYTHLDVYKRQALSFAPSEYGVTFTLNGGEALPGVVQVEMTGDNAAYTRIYLHLSLIHISFSLVAMGKVW